MNFGERLLKAREHAGLTQEMLAKKSGVKQGTISKIERGDTDSSTFTVQLSIACGVRPEWLAIEDGEMVDGLYVDDPKARAVLLAMKQMPEFKKDMLVQASHSLAEPAEGTNGKK